MEHLPHFFSYIYFCNTSIVLSKLKEYDSDHLCPDTYENIYDEFYCRKIDKIKLKNINFTENIFIKPVDNSKSFDGFIVTSQKNLDELKYIDPDMDVYKSEIINIIAEYRLLIGNGKIYGSAHMKGIIIENYLNIINVSKLIELTGLKFRCVDVGFISTDKWLVVEVNPMYSLDDYNMNIINYMNFCIDAD